MTIPDHIMARAAMAWAVEPNWKSGKSVMDRFEELYIPEPNSGCWLWLGNIYSDAKPYGRISVGRKIWQSHRFSYHVFKGDVPDGAFVCHHCDNPMCVNPYHLFLGTPKDNSLDRNNKRRHAHGEKVGTGKLTFEQACEIYLSDKPNRELADTYGVDITSIQKLRRGASWKLALAAIRNRSVTEGE
jgi:hypothetical protein